MKYNENGEKLIEHHIHYKEIHGYDETVWLTDSEHKKLHYRLRREGKCTITVKELNKISKAACGRTKKCKKQCAEYSKKNRQWLTFDEQSIGINVRLLERIVFNRATNYVSYSARFHAREGLKLPIIEIN